MFIFKSSEAHRYSSTGLEQLSIIILVQIPLPLLKYIGTYDII